MDFEVEKILSLATPEGFFPTYYARKGSPILESSEVMVDNYGIHTFVLEKILDLFGDNILIRDAFQKGLDSLLRDSVAENGRQLWRWLNKPILNDSLYPCDYDDTSRARVVIEKAKVNGFKLPEEFVDFDFSSFVKEGLTPYGVFTFIGQRPSNTTCPVVNANILNAFSLHLRNRGLNPENDETFSRVKDYLEETLRDWEFQLEDFSRLSKFYLSHMFLSYLISEQKNNFSREALDLVKRRVEKEEGLYRNPLESAWTTSILLNLGGDKKLIESGVSQIEETKNVDSLWDAYPIYQHQRSQTIFGSSVGTSIFCLEALSKYKNLRSNG